MDFRMVAFQGLMGIIIRDARQEPQKLANQGPTLAQSKLDGEPSPRSALSAIFTVIEEGARGLHLS